LEKEKGNLGAGQRRDFRLPALRCERQRLQQPAIGENRKILVVDDNPVVSKAFELKLKALGFRF